jgi:ribonucleoside-diphosphate reductase alpha chain
VSIVFIFESFLGCKDTKSFPKRVTFNILSEVKFAHSDYFLYLCIEKINQVMEEDIRKETLKRVAHELAVAGQKQNAPLSEEQIIALLEQRLMTVIPEVTEVRPQVLECDVVRFQNNKEKWVALVGLLDGYPYEIFTGLQDDEEGIMLPKTVTHGKIIKQVNPDGSKRYDFQFENKRGYKTTVEGLSEKFNPEYWNYAKLISGVLRYRMPLEHVIKLVASLSLKDESINTWKTGVERALKKYIPGSEEEVKNEE